MLRNHALAEREVAQRSGIVAVHFLRATSMCKIRLWRSACGTQRTFGCSPSNRQTPESRIRFGKVALGSRFESDDPRQECDVRNVRLDFDLHELECPHCEQQTRYSWPGVTILFSTARCEHCGMDFLIVQNKPWLGDRRTNRCRNSWRRSHRSRMPAVPISRPVFPFSAR